MTALLLILVFLLFQTFVLLCCVAAGNDAASQEISDEEQIESEQYDDFEDFLSTIEDKYGFKLSNCQWMVSDELKVYKYANGEEVYDA